MFQIAMSLCLKSVLLLCMFTLVWAEHVNVYITNNLEGNEDLKVHCKSKDNDLGDHLLHINQTYTWGFETNFFGGLFGGTLFFCSFQWGNGRLLYIDAYNQAKDFNICLECHWYIHKNRPCRIEVVPPPAPRGTHTLKCYDWK